MILQIKNEKIKNNLSDLDLVVSPANGDWYFVVDQGCVYSYYENSRNNTGAWVEDRDLKCYERSSVLGSGFTDVTDYYSEESQAPSDVMQDAHVDINNGILVNNKISDVIYITSGNSLTGLDLPYNTKIVLYNSTGSGVKIIKNSNKASLNQRIDIAKNKTLSPKESVSFFRSSLDDKWKLLND